MITSSALLIFIGSFILYNTSEKATLNSNLILEKWVQSNNKHSKYIGAILTLLPLFYILDFFGTTSGILYWSILLMIILGLTIIISPLNKITYRSVSIIFLFFLTLELTL